MSPETRRAIEELKKDPEFMKNLMEELEHEERLGRYFRQASYNWTMGRNQAEFKFYGDALAWVIAVPCFIAGGFIILACVLKLFGMEL